MSRRGATALTDAQTTERILQFLRQIGWEVREELLPGLFSARHPHVEIVNIFSSPEAARHCPWMVPLWDNGFICNAARLGISMPARC